MKVWKEIMKGKKNFFVTAEFGPAPYMRCVPGTNVPIADLDTVNLNMARMLRGLETKPFSSV